MIQIAMASKHRFISTASVMEVRQTGGEIQRVGGAVTGCVGQALFAFIIFPIMFAISPGVARRRIFSCRKELFMMSFIEESM